jgi:hypothetical protein
VKEKGKRRKGKQKVKRPKDIRSKKFTLIRSRVKYPVSDRRALANNRSITLCNGEEPLCSITLFIQTITLLARCSEPLFIKITHEWVSTGPCPFAGIVLKKVFSDRFNPRLFKFSMSALTPKNFAGAVVTGISPTQSRFWISDFFSFVKNKTPLSPFSIIYSCQPC